MSVKEVVYKSNFWSIKYIDSSFFWNYSLLAKAQTGRKAALSFQ